VFEIFVTDEAGSQLNELKSEKSLKKRYKAVIKSIGFLAANSRHQSLNTHEFTSLKGPKGKKCLKHMRNSPHPRHTEFSGIMAHQKIR